MRCVPPHKRHISAKPSDKLMSHQLLNSYQINNTFHASTSAGAGTIRMWHKGEKAQFPLPFSTARQPQPSHRHYIYVC